MEEIQGDLSHHNRLEYCKNRLSYRDGRKLTAVKVNSIAIYQVHCAYFTFENWFRFRCIHSSMNRGICWSLAFHASICTKRLNNCLQNMVGFRAFRRLPINCPVMQQVCRLFNRFGFCLVWANTHACNLRFAFTVEIEQFTDCYYIEYEKVHFARRAKAFVDRKNFYGGMSKDICNERRFRQNECLSSLFSLMFLNWFRRHSPRIICARIWNCRWRSGKN